MVKDEITTVQLRKQIVKELNKLKKYERQTYSEVIADLITFAKSERMNASYEEFIRLAQQQRMRELWDNKEDEVWGHV